MKVKVLGAGSIGNHLSHASRRLGWSVDLVDTDPNALERAKNTIYPERYGRWDEQISTHLAEHAPQGGFDLIIIGTPPDTHMALARAAVKEKPRAILVEKPLCGPDLAGAQELADEAAEAGVAVFVGYDHVVGKASQHVEVAFDAGFLGEVDTLDVEFREHWGGIFAAHPWLSGPWESYLGFWKRGGGASGEHSHATSLWQHFAHLIGAGRVVEVDATLDFVRDDRLDYDKLCLMNFRTEKGILGRCIQDVVTQPPRKWARIQGSTGAVEWMCNARPGVDSVVTSGNSVDTRTQEVSKTRPDDFIAELNHIKSALETGPEKSPIALARGLDTMLVIAAAHLSSKLGRRVKIDYSQGWRPAALIKE